MRTQFTTDDDLPSMTLGQVAMALFLSLAVWALLIAAILLAGKAL